MKEFPLTERQSLLLLKEEFLGINGIPCSKETRQKISETNKKNPWNKGKPMSEQHRQAIIEGKKRKRLTY